MVVGFFFLFLLYGLRRGGTCFAISKLHFFLFRIRKRFFGGLVNCWMWANDFLDAAVACIINCWYFGVFSITIWLYIAGRNDLKGSYANSTFVLRITRSNMYVFINRARILIKENQISVIIFTYTVRFHFYGHYNVASILKKDLHHTDD